MVVDGVKTTPSFCVVSEPGFLKQFFKDGSPSSCLCVRWSTP